VCLAKIKNAFEINRIQRGRVTCCMDETQPERSSEKGRSLDRVNLVNAQKARAGTSSRAATRISLERSVHNLAVIHSSHFSPTQGRDKRRVPL
jgi:hypothetical protein